MQIEATNRNKLKRQYVILWMEDFSIASIWKFLKKWLLKFGLTLDLHPSLVASTPIHEAHVEMEGGGAGGFVLRLRAVPPSVAHLTSGII